MPALMAVQKLLDNYAEISLKKAIENMMRNLKIPVLIFRSSNLKAISALKDLGLKLPVDAEIDLMMAFVSGDFLPVREGFKNPRHGNFPWRELDVCPKDIDVQRWGIRNAFKKTL